MNYRDLDSMFHENCEDTMDSYEVFVPLADGTYVPLDAVTVDNENMVIYLHPKAG